MKEEIQGSPHVQGLRQLAEQMQPGATAQRQKQPAPIQRNGHDHPLSSDHAENNIGVLNLLRDSREDATLRQLLLGELPEGRKIMSDYEKETDTGVADAILLRSILATLELHQSGVWYQAVIQGNTSVLGPEEERLIAIMQEAYDRREELAGAYGLTKVELHAIECYTQPGKNKPGPWFMGPHEKWEGYKTGWDALEVALSKLPTLKQLGLELTTYRAVRSDDSTRKKETGIGQDPTPEKLGKLAAETNIKHGSTPIPPYGQKHYISTGITYTSSHMTSERLQPGVVAMTGSSGVYVGPFGVAHWSHDAGEVLYPPEIYSKYEGVAPEGFHSGRQSAPVYHLREVARPERGQKIVEDKDYTVKREQHPRLNTLKTAMIREIDEIASTPEGREKITSAREATDVHGPIMYLEYDDLKSLYIAITGGESPLVEAKKMQMIGAIDKIGSTPAGRKKVARARAETGIQGPLMYLNSEALNELYQHLMSL
jgi:hypothetical protein